MRNITERTLITAIVNLKCVGYFGKCLTHLSQQERTKAIDEIYNRGWVSDKTHWLTPKGDEIVKRNLDLCQY